LASFFALRDVGLLGFFVLCCGGDFATTSTARSKRAHASGFRFNFSIGSFDMAPKPKKPTKAERAEGKKYLRALGWFVTFFAVVENQVHKTLWKFVGVNQTIAACVFSGTRIDGAISYLKRIAEATNWSKDRKALLDHLALQLGEITQLRNDLLHYGTTGETANALVVSNEKFAHIKSRIRETKISTSILDDVTYDLMAILFQLGELAGEHDWHKHRSPMTEAADLGVIPGALAKVPWRYKPVRQGNQAQRLPDRPPKPKRLPRSSRP
jgi:hypothetical protein